MRRGDGDDGRESSRDVDGLVKEEAAPSALSGGEATDTCAKAPRSKRPHREVSSLRTYFPPGRKERQLEPGKKRVRRKPDLEVEWQGCLCHTDRHLLTNSLPFEGLWIQCDDCRRWLHGECTGLDAEQLEAVDTYTCRLCAHAKAESRTPQRGASAAAALGSSLLLPTPVPSLAPSTSTAADGSDLWSERGEAEQLRERVAYLEASVCGLQADVSGLKSQLLGMTAAFERVRRELREERA